MAAGFGRHDVPPPVSNPDLLPFYLETGVRVVSKVGDPSFQILARWPLGYRIICYVRDGLTDGGQKQRLLPHLYGRRHSNGCQREALST